MSSESILREIRELPAAIRATLGKRALRPLEQLLPFGNVRHDASTLSAMAHLSTQPWPPAIRRVPWPALKIRPYSP